MTSGPTGAGALELRGPTVALLDEPLALQLRGLGGASSDGVVWRGRVRDDDGRVWRAAASSALKLAGRWKPAKSSAGQLAALQSLRPVALEVRVEAPDGRGGSRTFTRRLLGDGVRVRRWRDGVAATLFLPATAQPAAAVVLDATAGDDATLTVTLAAALLASRGVVAFAVAPPRDPGADVPRLLASAVERLAQIPAAAGVAGGVQLLSTLPPVPPGVPAQIVETAPERAERWDALLAQLGAEPRQAASAASSTARPSGDSS